MPDDQYLTGLRDNMQRNSKYAMPGNYATQLTPEQEVQFQQWVAQNKVPFNPGDAVADYDMRGFWQALQKGDPRASTAVNEHDKQIHFPDIWKTPYHKTFSADSQWAMPNAPKWKGSQLIDARGKVLHDEAAQ